MITVLIRFGLKGYFNYLEKAWKGMLSNKDSKQEKIKELLKKLSGIKEKHKPFLKELGVY